MGSNNGNHGNRKSGLAGKRKSPWSKGPNCGTRRAKDSYEEILEQRREQAQEGKRRMGDGS